MIYYNIARDYTKTPGTEACGKNFRETVLIDLIGQALLENTKLIIDLAGVKGYAPSFLKSAFADLIKFNNFTKEEVLNVLVVKCDEVPLIVDKVYEMINESNKVKPTKISKKELESILVWLADYWGMTIDELLNDRMFIDLIKADYDFDEELLERIKA